MAGKRNSATGGTDMQLTTSGSGIKRRVAIGAAGLAGAATVALGLGVLLPALASASTKTVFPGSSNTGVPSGMVLKTVPGQVSSGPGWTYSAAEGVTVSGAGAVLSGLSIPCNVNITASNVTLKDDRIVTGGDFGVSLRNTAGATIENSTISGSNATTGRVTYAIDDIYENSTGMVISDNNISAFNHGVQVSAGTVTGNYIHDPGYLAGDHIDGVFDPGNSGVLVINDNTILNNMSQTSAINLDAPAGGQTVSNKTIENNLLGGGGYAIYAASTLGNTTSNIVIKNNRFSQVYFANSGEYGPAVYFNSQGTGNAWTGNVWDSTGQTIPAP